MTKCKLCYEDREKVRDLMCQGSTKVAVCKMFGVSKSTINRIIANENDGPDGEEPEIVQASYSDKGPVPDNFQQVWEDTMKLFKGFKWPENGITIVCEGDKG